jgi:peptidoglycan/xylan/chitin deacetylase (PgdA/CDA1 family)
MYPTSFHHAVRPLRGLERIRSIARDCALSVCGLVSRPSKTSSLRALYCHYVFDDQRREFEAVVRYVQSIGKFIGTDEVLDVLEGRKPIEQNLFHLSFDDGFKNVITNALPVLREYRVPATFFVPTAIISAPAEQVENYCRAITNYPAVIEIATWGDLEKACAAGLEIGSHTRTHARLSAVSQSRGALEDEIFGSKADLEKRLGRACNYISWPYGRITDADTRSLRAVEQAGYRACFGAFRGRVIPKMTDRFCIPRHHFEVQWPLAHVKCFTHGAMERKTEI